MTEVSGLSSDAITDCDAVVVALHNLKDQYAHKLEILLTRHRAEITQIVKYLLGHPMRATAGFDLLPFLTMPEKESLLPVMLPLCSSGGYAHRVKPFIAELPLKWLLANIEAEAEVVLALNEELDWVNILDVYQRIDAKLALGLARRMAKHTDAGIREWGSEFLLEQQASQ